MTYWERRKLAALRRMESTTLNQISEIITAFEQAKKGVEAEVQSFYGRYAEHNKVTLEQAQKALSPKELHNFHDRLKDYERLAKRAIGTFDLQVDNLSTRARITRLQALEMDIDAILQELYQRQRDGVEGAVGRLYTDQYYRAQFDLSKASGCLINFAKVDQTAISAVMAYPVMGADLSSRLWRQDVDIGFRIRQTLGRMFAEGRPAQDFADDLAKAIGAVQVDKDGNVTGAGKKFEAYRLLYTEAAYASERASQQAYQDDGIERYQYLATFDTDTCGICGALDGKTFEVKDAVPGVNSPPMHPFCRCTTIPVIDGLKSVAGERAARDPKTGKTITVPGDMTYREWYNRYVNGDLNDIKLENIKVTDEAIRKVPKIEVSGLTDQQNLTLQQKHQELLRIARDRPVGTEVAIGLDDNLEETGRMIGEAYSVRPPTDGATIILHNHPSGNTFTIEDISVFALHENLRVITAVGNDGSLYAIEKTAEFEFAGMYQALRRAMQATPDYLDSPDKYLKMVRDFLTGGKSYGIRYQEKAD